VAEIKELFRKSTLDRLASSERFDQLVTFASPRHWATLAGLAILLALAALWYVLGAVP
jgi:hypothetical protein